MDTCTRLATLLIASRRGAISGELACTRAHRCSEIRSLYKSHCISRLQSHTLDQMHLSPIRQPVRKATREISHSNFYSLFLFDVRDYILTSRRYSCTWLPPWRWQGYKPTGWCRSSDFPGESMHIPLAICLICVGEFNKGFTRLLAGKRLAITHSMLRAGARFYLFTAYSRIQAAGSASKHTRTHIRTHRHTEKHRTNARAIRYSSLGKW